MKTKRTNGNKGNNAQSGLPRRSYGRQFKVLVAESYLSTPSATYASLAKVHGISANQVKHWAHQYTDGLLDESNAVAFSTRPMSTAGKKEALVNLRVTKA